MNNFIKLGIFTAAGFLAIVISIIATGSFSFSETYDIYAKFDNISGLTKKSKVKIAGVDIGILKEISLDGSKAKLKLSINKRHILYKNAIASIVSMGIIGTKYIEIIPGDANFGEIKNGDYISIKQSVSLEETLNNITSKLNDAFDNQKTGNLMQNLADAVYALKEFLENIDAQNSNINYAIKNIADISNKIDIIVTRIYNGEGTVGTLINDRQMSEDLKQTVMSVKETADNLNKFIRRGSDLRISWEYLGRYDLKDKRFRNDIGIEIAPNPHKFYYVGISNIGDKNDNSLSETEKENLNSIDALLGFRGEKSEIFAGMIRTKAGIGFGYSFFQPIYAPYKLLQARVTAYNFSREKHGTEINAGIRIGITKWLYAGIMVEDIAYKSSLTPYVKIKIDDKDLASIFGIASIAAVASK
jgi:phospholipid/cholesterol/gamma-HCH transport system substrate-binding protein